MEAFFAHPQNAGVVAKAFRMMESKWLKYDADRSRKLSIGELSNLMAAELPNLWANSQGKIAEFYPESDRAVTPLPCSTKTLTREMMAHSVVVRLV